MYTIYVVYIHICCVSKVMYPTKYQNLVEVETQKSLTFLIESKKCPWKCSPIEISQLNLATTPSNLLDWSYDIWPGGTIFLVRQSQSQFLSLNPDIMKYSAWTRLIGRIYTFGKGRLCDECICWRDVHQLSTVMVSSPTDLTHWEFPDFFGSWKDLYAVSLYVCPVCFKVVGSWNW